jgi:hypothetical protein
MIGFQCIYKKIIYTFFYAVAAAVKNNFKEYAFMAKKPSRAVKYTYYVVRIIIACSSCFFKIHLFMLYVIAAFSPNIRE